MVLRGNFLTKEVWLDGKELRPGKSQFIQRHSDGFDWGNGGGGSVQLALAVMLEFVDRSTALKLYQKFQQEIIANLPQTDFELAIDINKWMAEKIREKPKSSFWRW